MANNAQAIVERLNELILPQARGRLLARGLAMLFAQEDTSPFQSKRSSLSFALRRITPRELRDVALVLL